MNDAEQGHYRYLIDRLYALALEVKRFDLDEVRAAIERKRAHMITMGWTGVNADADLRVVAGLAAAQEIFRALDAPAESLR